jgi:hypothetical protein
MYAEPLAKQIVLHHVGYYTDWGWSGGLFHFLLFLWRFMLF